MQPRKTALAHTTLEAHRAALGMRQRRLLILCDGQRSVTELTQLMGQDAPAMVVELIREGYLVTGAAPAAQVSQTSPSATSARPTATPAPCTTPAAAAAPPDRRRSMAAARLYLLDILEMQRNPAAAALFHQLQQARGDDDILDALQAALRALPTMTREGFAQRVTQRVLEVLPHEHLDRFQGVPEASAPLSA